MTAQQQKMHSHTMNLVLGGATPRLFARRTSLGRILGSGFQHHPAASGEGGMGDAWFVPNVGGGVGLLWAGFGKGGGGGWNGQ
jgi:hypothetical protein